MIIGVSRNIEGKTSSAGPPLIVSVSPSIIPPGKSGAAPTGARHRTDTVEAIMSDASIKALSSGGSPGGHIAIVGARSSEAVCEIKHVTRWRGSGAGGQKRARGVDLNTAGRQAVG